MRRNILAGETSPYLLQHKDNPVHWQTWSEAAFAQARTEKKPVLLSVGYAACHWCHVMAHESFESPEIAALMNEHFISIKVDREERPDVDTIYQTALALLGQQGGWPLTMFLTPEGKPFWGGTYFPPTPRYGHPAFPQVLETLSRTYRDDPERIVHSVNALVQGLADVSAGAPGDSSSLSPPALDDMARTALVDFDLAHGGRMGAPKFPEVPLLRLLWTAHLRTGEAAFADAVTVTLDNLCQGGIYDHLGGGFARYSTDAQWLVPHFEKMLYDNAQLVEILGAVWRRNRSPLYARRVAETIAWVLRDLRQPGGAFAGSLDADSEGGEGAFYVFSEAEVDSLLGAQAEPFKTAYGVTPSGNFEGRVILNRLGAMAWRGEADEAVLAEQCAVLLAVREGRPRPGLDDKILTDWNAMMIAALADAAAAFERADWLTAAETAFQFIIDNLSKGGRLAHSWCAGRRADVAVLDDYAHMARAALALYQVTGEVAYFDHARTFADTANREFRDDLAGGYFLTSSAAPDLITRTRTAHDTATPSANGVLTEVLARLHHLTGEDAYREDAELTVGAFVNRSPGQLLSFPTLLVAFDLLANGVQIVVIGSPEDGATQSLCRAVHGTALPAAVLQRVAPGADLPVSHPAHAKTKLDGRATAYICRGHTCGPPQTDGEALKEALASL